MVSNSRPFFFRLLCLFLACLFLANALIIPVRASVVGFLGFTVRSLIASLIRACGVYVADGIQDSLSDGLSVWESLVDYIAAHVPAEYLYINAAGEKFIKMILKDGLYYADRNLVEWVLEELTSIGETSSGDYVQPIGYGFNFSDYHQQLVTHMFQVLEDQGYYYGIYTRNLSKCYIVEFDKTTDLGPYNSPFIVFTNGAFDWSLSDDGYLDITVGAGHSIVLYTDQYFNEPDGMYRDSSSSAHHWRTTVSSANCTVYGGTITIDLDDTVGPAPADSIKSPYIPSKLDPAWTSQAISVVDESTGGTVVGVPVSVPSDDTEDTAVAPWGDVTSGTEAGSPSISIPGTGTDVGTGSGSEAVPDTDTSTQTGFWATVVSWFKTIWQTLKDILSGVLAIPIAITQAIATAIADVIAAIKSLVPEPPSFDEFQIPSLQSFFPFCIPFDLLDMMRALNASPVAPSFTFACPLPGGGVHYVNIDLSAWNGVASTIRSVTMAIYVVVLANSTRKFIKW